MGSVFSKIIEENFPKLRGKDAHLYLRSTEYQLRLEKETPHYHIDTTLNIQNKERTLRAPTEKSQVTQKGRHIRITADLSVEIKSEKLGKIYYRFGKITAANSHLIKTIYRNQRRKKIFPWQKHAKGIYDHQAISAKDTRRNIWD